MSNRLGRLDEGATDVVASDQAQLEGETGGFRIAERRRHTAIGYGHDHVRFDRLIFPQSTPHALTGVVDANPVEGSVGPRKIDVLEDAHVPPLGAGAEGPEALEPRLVDDHHLAGLDVTDELRADQLKRGWLRSDDVRVVELSEAQWTEPVGVAHRHEFVGREKDE